MICRRFRRAALKVPSPVSRRSTISTRRRHTQNNQARKNICAMVIRRVYRKPIEYLQIDLTQHRSFQYGFSLSLYRSRRLSPSIGKNRLTSKRKSALMRLWLQNIIPAMKRLRGRFFLSAASIACSRAKLSPPSPNQNFRRRRRNVSRHATRHYLKALIHSKWKRSA